MATTALLPGASPLKLQQGTLFRPLPSKPVKLISTAAAFSYQRRCFKNPKPAPQCYSLLAQKTTHYLTTTTGEYYSKSSSSSDLLHTPLSSTQYYCLMNVNNRPPAAANPNVIIELCVDESVEVLRKPAKANSTAAAADLAAPAGRFGGSITSYSSATSYNSSGLRSLTTTNKDYPRQIFYEPIYDERGVYPVFLYSVGSAVGSLLMMVVALRFPRILNAGPVFFSLWTLFMTNWLYSVGQTSVVKLQLQVNSSIMGRAVQMDLNRIGKTVPSSCTYEGLRYLLRDTAVALLRQPDHCISGFSSVVMPKYTRAAALQCFNNLAVKEEVRYDVEEMVVNTEPQSTTSSQRLITDDESHNDDVMVTILVAADGEYSKWLTITDRSDSNDVRRVLERLASMDPSKQIFGLEVVWTPHLSSNAAASKSIVD